MSFTAYLQFGTIFFARINKTENLFHLFAINLWTLISLEIKWIAKAFFLGIFDTTFDESVVNAFMDECARTSATTLALIEK